MEATLEKQDTSALKASISLGNLKHALKITGMANSKASLIPILQGVMLQQMPDGLAIEATDLDVFIRVVLPELGGPQAPIVTPAEKFCAWTKLLTGSDVMIGTTSSTATLRCGRAKVVLPLMPPKNWPSDEFYKLKANGTTLSQGAFARALRMAQIAISTEESRYTLNGVQIQGDGSQLRVVSTQGHCLMLYTFPCEEKIDLLLPGRLVKVLLPLMSDEDGGVDLIFNDSKILASIDADMKIFVGAPRLAGKFPDWNAAIPRDKRTDFTVSSADLMASLMRCALLSDENSTIDIIFASGEITLKAANSMHGEADDTVPCEGQLAEELHTRINGDYLRALLHELKGDLTIGVPSKNDRALIFRAAPHDGETLTYVIAPMRV